MPSTTTVIVTMIVKPESLQEMVDAIPELLAGMLARPGALATRALQSPADPTRLLFIDEFETVDAAEAYFRWRADRGDVDRMGRLLAAPPQVDIWPVSILAG